VPVAPTRDQLHLSVKNPNRPGRTPLCF